MIPDGRFSRDKATIRADLERRARARQVITYGEAAALVGWWSQGLGKIPTSIWAEEARQGRPDLGALIVRISTGLPSYVGAGQDAREKAIAVQEAVFVASTEKR